ncbi:MAG: hypothetical protein WCA63_02595 [Gallionella sp.]
MDETAAQNWSSRALDWQAAKCVFVSG